VAEYLLASDLHLSDRAPSSCTDSYCDDLFDLLGQMVTVAKVREVKAVVFAGDVFHNKAPNRTSHRLVRRFIEVCHAFERPVLIVAGNHDMRNDRVDTIDQTQPLGVVFESGAAQQLSGWWFPPGGAPFADIYGQPWLQEFSDENVKYALAQYKLAMQPALLVTHAPLYPAGKELPWEHYPAVKWAIAMGKGYCFYGHVHEPHGQWALDGDFGLTDEYDYGPVVFCNYGALSRGSLHEYNLERPVGATIWNSVTGLFEFVKLNAKPKELVFRLEEKQQKTDMQGRLAGFLADIGTTVMERLTIETVIERIREQKPGTDVERLAEELLTGAVHGVDGGRA
jgi:DNA repair exonuclease SbcCD nuclease subunit